MNILTKIKSFTDVGTVDPARDDKQVFKVLLIAERFGVAISAVVSGLAFAAWGWNFAGDLFDNILFKSFVAGAVLIGSTYLTDIAIKYIFQKGAYDFFLFWKFAWVKDFRKQWFIRLMQLVAWTGLISVGASMFAVDFFSVDAVKTAVGDVVKQEKTINQDSLRGVVLAQEKIRMSSVEGAIIAAAADIRSTEQQIKAEKNRVLNSDKAMKKLVDKGNGWAASQVRTRQDKAVAPLIAQLAELRANKLELERQRTKDIAYHSQVVAASDSSNAAYNAAVFGRNLDRQDGAKNMTMYLGVGSKAIAIAIRILLVALFLAYSYKDVNNDGQIDHEDVNAAAAVGFRAG